MLLSSLQYLGRALGLPCDLLGADCSLLQGSTGFVSTQRPKVNSWSRQMQSWVKTDTVCVTSSEDCKPGKDWYWEPVLLLLFESDSSRQMHWIASVSCALYQRLIFVGMHDVWVTNHHLLWRSCAFPWKCLESAVFQLKGQLTAFL